MTGESAGAHPEGHSGDIVTAGATASGSPSGLLSGFHLPRQPRALLALALAALAVFLALAPQGPGINDLLAAATQERAVYRYDRAQAFYAQARALAANDPRVACAAGDLSLLQRQPALAVAAYQTCVARDPGDAAGWLNFGDALAARGASGDATAARAAWRRAGELNTGEASADGWARLALADERAGQFAAATTAWVQVPAESGQSELAAAHLGLLALASGDSDAARVHLALLATISSPLAIQLRDNGVFLFDQRPPEGALDWLGIGHALLALGLPQLALAPLQRAVALDPTNGSAHAYYGYTLWFLGQRNAARPEIAAGLVDAPYVPFADYAAGQEALGEGKATLALAHFQRALRLDTRNAVLWSAAGDAALAASEYSVAELSYKNAAQDSATPDATITLVQFYLTHGIGFDDGTALATASAAVGRFPASEPLVSLQAQIENTAGQSAYAQGLFTLATQLDPTDPGPWFYLGQYAAATGDVVPAANELSVALSLQPDGLYASRARAALGQLPANTL